MIPRLVIAMNYFPRPEPGAGASLVITSSAAARHPALTLFAIAPQLLVKDILERKTLSLMLALEVGLHFLAFLVLTQRLDRQPDTPFLAVDLDHDCLDLVAHLVERRRLVDALVAELRDMDESLDTLFQLDEDAEVRNRTHFSANPGIQRIALRHGIPRIQRELLDAEAYALLVDLNSKHHGLDLVTFLEKFGRMAHLLGPRKIGDVHQAVDPGFDLDEHTKVGDRFDLALDRAADRMALRERLPWIRFDLLEPE